MGQYNLTSEEVLLIYLTFMATDEEGSHSEYFNQWFENGGKERLRELFNSLKEKGVILKSYNPESYIPNEIQFNKIFLKGWLKNSYELGSELFKAYPPFLNINGSYYPLRDVSKRFSSLEEFFFYYGKSIGHNPEKHKEIMDILEWAKESNLINFGILNFVVSRQWISLKELMENPELIPVSQNSILTDE